jgi:hypothetical protein
MAVFYGKSSFPWVQSSGDRIHDPAGISATGNWQLAIRRSRTHHRTNPEIITLSDICACLRSSAAEIGGRL